MIVEVRCCEIQWSLPLLYVSESTVSETVSYVRLTNLAWFGCCPWEQRCDLPLVIFLPLRFSATLAGQPIATWIETEFRVRSKKQVRCLGLDTAAKPHCLVRAGLHWSSASTASAGEFAHSSAKAGQCHYAKPARQSHPALSELPYLYCLETDS